MSVLGRLYFAAMRCIDWLLSVHLSLSPFVNFVYVWRIPHIYEERGG